VLDMPTSAPRRRAADELTAPADHGDPTSGPDLVRLYLDEIGRHPLLSAEDEVRLGTLVQRGLAARRRLEADPDLSAAERRELRRAVQEGQDATAEFVRANLRLVVSVARRYHYPGVALLDLIQDGNLGLLHAVEKFDPRKGYKFSTYATWWIRQAMSRGVDQAGKAIRVPSHAEDQRRVLERAHDELEARLRRRPTRAELATETGTDPATVERLLATPTVAASLDQPVADDASALGDLVPDESDPTPEGAVLRADTAPSVDRLLAVLDDRERAIVRMRYGLGGDGEEHSMPEVARAFGLSRERIRQIEANAFSKLRHPSNELHAHDLLA
jgi:RNA polymerase sigma factor (sigma-70 family)